MHSAGATLISRFINAITTVFTLAIAAHALTKSEFGVVAVLTLLSTFLGFGDFGLGTLLMTRLPQAHARDDSDEKRDVVNVTLTTLCVTGGLIALLGGISAFILPWQSLLGAGSIPENQVRAAVFFFFVLGGLSIPAMVGGRVLAAMLHAAVAQWWFASASILSLLGVIACSVGNLPIWAYVIAITGIPALVALVQTMWVLTRTFPDLRPTRVGADPKMAWAFLQASFFFAILVLSSAISYGIDSLVVSSILGASVAAVFAIAVRMFALVGVTIGLAGQQLWSALTDAITRGEYDWARSRYRNTLLISTGISVVACAFLIVFGQWLARIWVGSELVPPQSLLVVLAIYTVYSTLILQATYLLTAVEKVRIIAFVGLVMAAVNLAASIFLTHKYGINGPILGSILALALVMTVPVFVLCRQVLRTLGEGELSLAAIE